MILYDPKTREAWLTLRRGGIGGSDAGTVLGLNKYKTNLELWEEKTGRAESEFTGNEATRYGHDAEEHIRALFHLDHPDYNLDYHEFRMHGNEKYPFMYATLDGELTGYGRKGILEIKTATIQNNGQWREWENRIPDTYFAQVVHQLTVTEWDFAYVRAYLRYYSQHGELRATIRDYYIDADDIKNDAAALIEAETKFWDCVISGREPGLILPEI